MARTERGVFGSRSGSAAWPWLRHAGSTVANRTSEILLVLAVTTGLVGCSRKFFREYADDEVSHVLAEKDCDRRWRLPRGFTVYPPARARFADPHDPDHPPMPPDDPAAYALAPRSQCPPTRLAVPTEGTGYLMMLRRFTAAGPDGARAIPLALAAGTGAGRAWVSVRGDQPLFNLFALGFQAAQGSAADRWPALARRHAGPARPPADSAIDRTEYQSDRPRDQPKTTSRAAAGAGSTPGDQPLPPQYASDAASYGARPAAPGSGPAELTARPALPSNAAVFADIPDREAGIGPQYTLNLTQMIELALVNSRVYQSREENLYLTALPVTLQRHLFYPRWFGTNDLQYTHLGRLFAGGPSDTLTNTATVGFTKLFASGASLMAQLANETVWQFHGGRGPRLTSVSMLSLDLMQPLLRGAGRAVVLEPLTQAERNLLYEIRNFARFRQEFYVGLLGGGAISGVTTPTFVGVGTVAGATPDPIIGYYRVLQAYDTWRNAVENYRILRRQRIEEEAKFPAGRVGVVEVDQVRQSELDGKSEEIRDWNTYQNTLDSFKLQLGLPADTPLKLEPAELVRLREAYAQLRRNGLEPLQLDPDAGVRIAMANRLDLMNARAQLADAWRQIKVTANALQGVVNFDLHADLGTPAGRDRPFDFRLDASRETVTLHTELPLDRLAERNSYRTALINYQRARRNLMQFQDQVAQQVRSELLALDQNRTVLEIQENALRLAQRRVELTRYLILSGPLGGGKIIAITRDFLEAQRSVLTAQNTLTAARVDYAVTRMELFRDLGIMHIDERGVWDNEYLDPRQCGSAPSWVRDPRSPRPAVPPRPAGAAAGIPAAG